MGNCYQVLSFSLVIGSVVWRLCGKELEKDKVARHMNLTEIPVRFLRRRPPRRRWMPRKELSKKSG